MCAQLSLLGQVQQGCAPGADSVISLVLTCSFHLQSAGQGSSEGAAGKEGNVFAQLGLLGRSNKAVPQALTRRALELLTYMAKHHVRVAREMLSIRVPTPEEQAQLIDQKPVRPIPVSCKLHPNMHSSSEMLSIRVPTPKEQAQLNDRKPLCPTSQSMP